MNQRWRHALVTRLESTSRLVDTERGPIEISEAGEGRPILFVHGAPGGCELGLLIARQFPEPGVRWVSPSRPGYLRTPLTVASDLPDQADALAGLLDALGIERVPVLAHSTGGAVALHFAARHPGRCAALAIGAGVSRPLSSARALRLAATSLPPLIAAAELPGHGSAWVLRRIARAVARIRPGGRTPHQLAALPELTESILPTDLRAPGLINDILQLAKLAPLPYREVRCPLFLVHGTGDLVVPVAHSRLTVKHLPSTPLRLVPGGQHHALYVLSAARRAEILDFLLRAA